MNSSNIAETIDHTLLAQTATKTDIMELCAQARKKNFANVCVAPKYVELAATCLSGAKTGVCTVIGFPHGNCGCHIKVEEALTAIADGADELDMVADIGAIREGDFSSYAAEVAELAGICHQAGAKLKVIIETCLLDDNEKEKASLEAAKSGADFVKTSTGFAGGGATIDDVKLMKKAISGTLCLVKASGGISTKESAEALLEAGASRLGTSHGMEFVD